MPTPNELYGWFPGNQQIPGGSERWMTLPGQSPAADQSQGMLGWLNNPGDMTTMAHELAGAPRMKPGAGMSLSGSSGMYGSGASYGDSGGGSDAFGQDGKIAGAATGAAAGMQYGGPWGAVLGGVAGYAMNGGAEDLNPIEASGFTGLTMDEAWEDGNLARLGSNPAGALAQRYIGYDSALSPTSWGLGINENSFLGQALDPVRAMDPVSLFESGNNPEEKTRDQYYTDPKLFTEGLVGEFRGSRSTYPPRASGQYGARDDDKFAADMATRINSAYSSGQIDAGDDAYSIYEKVITPWFDSMGGMKVSKAPDQHTNLTIDMIQRYMSGSPITWQEARGGKPDYEVPAYLGRGG
jgi:hypothetical protein